MVVAREVIQQLKKTQEHMQLIPQERVLIKHLKARILGVAAIQKSRARQQSRMTWIKKGMPIRNSFHIMANARRKKKLHSFPPT
jgi:hypothetical protein